MKKKLKYLPTNINSYGLGSWIKDNKQGIIGGAKVLGGAALVATGVGAGAGAGLIASGAGDIGQEIISDRRAKEEAALFDEQQTELERQNLIQQRLYGTPQDTMQFAKGGNIYPNGGKLPASYRADSTITSNYRPSYIKNQSYGDFQKSDYGDLLKTLPLYDPNNPKRIIATENYYKGVPGPQYLLPTDTSGGERVESYDVNGRTRFAGSETPSFKSGGGIYIKPSKRGTFKAQASKMGMSVQGAASKILSAKEGTYSPAMRKKANFAKNFAKADGGYLEETRYNKDLTYYANGGTHESNPNQGVPIGNKGLVEQNEFRYKDYIFSDRLP